MNERRADFPTPRCTSMCGGTGSFEKVRELRRGGRITDDEAKAMINTHGQLNPDWVEWLMGWPVGHTDPERDPEPHARPLPDDPADLPPTDPGYVPRTTSRREHRAARIKALGNGQVPLCAAVALETMLETFSLLDRSIQHSAFSIQH